MSRQHSGGLLLLALLSACGDDPIDPPVIDSEATVGGFVYLDADGSETPTALDPTLEGMVVLAVAPGSGLTVASDTTDDAGAFLLEEIPVGTVDVLLSEEVLGDTLLAVPRDSTRFVLASGDTIVELLGATFPQLSLVETRAAASGRKIFTQGLVLNARGQAPDGAVHVQGDGVAIRVLVPPTASVLAGDSVRVLARTGVSLGQPALLEGEFFRIQPGARDVVPRPTTVGQARIAADGRDAELVELIDVDLVSETVVPEGFLAEVTDGTETLSVRLRADQGFVTGYSGFPGFVRLVGLLVPNEGDGTWSLVPRTRLDVRPRPPEPPTAGS